MKINIPKYRQPRLKDARQPLRQPARVTRRRCEAKRSRRRHLLWLKRQSFYTATPDDAGTPVWADGYGCNNGFFATLDELFDHCACEEAEPPSWVHPCAVERGCQIDADDIIERLTDDAPEDWHVEMEAELRDFVARFNAAQMDVWRPLSDVWVIDEEEFAAETAVDENGLPDIRYRPRRQPDGIPPFVAALWMRHGEDVQAE